MAHDKLKDTRKSTAAGKDEGRRMYLSDRPYQDQIRDKTLFGFGAQQPDLLKELYKHSEYVKPYREPDYEEMEYLMPPWWQFPPWWYDFDLPWYDDPIITGPIGAFRVFSCTVSGCFCVDSTICLDINCSHTPVDVNLSGVSAGEDFSVSISGGQLCITAGPSAPPSLEVDITMQTPEGILGTHGSIQILSCFPDDPDCGCLPEDSPSMACSGSTDMTPGGAGVLMTITGGTPPFSWSLTGDQHGGPGGGWSLDFSETVGNTNTIRCAATPNDCCGCASVSVTDACGRTIGIDDPGSSKCFFRSIGTSSFQPSGDDPVEIEWCTGTGWGDSDSLQLCDNDCYRHGWITRGPFYFATCPSTCLCANFLLEHPKEEAGCRHNCQYQPGARALGFCTVGLNLWKCA